MPEEKRIAQLILPERRLPRALSRIQRKYLSMAKSMNGNSVSLISPGVDTLCCLYEGKWYAIRRESFGMDRDLFDCEVMDIRDDLLALGCEVELWGR